MNLLNWNTVMAQRGLDDYLKTVGSIIVIGSAYDLKIVMECLEPYKDKVQLWDAARQGEVVGGVTVAVPPSGMPLAGEFSRQPFVLFNLPTADLRQPYLDAAKGYAYIDLLSNFQGFTCLCILHDIEKYNAANTDPDFAIDTERAQFQPFERFVNAGTLFNDTYLNMDLWGAKKVYANRPRTRHYDIASRVDGFVTHLLSFGVDVTLIDIRPLNTFGTPGIDFIQENATLLAGIGDQTIESMSALCSLEHFGLGRYGDPVDPSAHLHAMENIQRVLMPGANLYISLPIGPKNYVEYHLHRVYSPRYVVEKFSSMDLIEFSIADTKGLTPNAPLDVTDPEIAVGLFHFRKR